MAPLCYGLIIIIFLGFSFSLNYVFLKSINHSQVVKIQLKSNICVSIILSIKKIIKNKLQLLQFSFHKSIVKITILFLVGFSKIIIYSFLYSSHYFQFNIILRAFKAIFFKVGSVLSFPSFHASIYLEFCHKTNIMITFFQAF